MAPSPCDELSQDDIPPKHPGLFHDCSASLYSGSGQGHDHLAAIQPARPHHRVRLGGSGHASSAGTAARHPTAAYWLNLVEAFFSIITRQALHRGGFPTVADLIAAIERFIDAWNDRCAPFTWTKDPDTIIAKATHPRHRMTQQASVTDH